MCEISAASLLIVASYGWSFSALSLPTRHRHGFSKVMRPDSMFTWAREGSRGFLSRALQLGSWAKQLALFYTQGTIISPKDEQLRRHWIAFQITVLFFIFKVQSFSSIPWWNVILVLRYFLDKIGTEMQESHTEKKEKWLRGHAVIQGTRSRIKTLLLASFPSFTAQNNNLILIIFIVSC